MAAHHRSLRWYQILLLPITLPVGIGLMLVLLPLALISVPVAAVLMVCQARVETKFQRRMRAASRFVAWDDLTPTLAAGAGTLIIEQANKQPARVWWTPMTW